MNINMKEEYKNLENIIDTEIKNLNILQKKFKVFEKRIFSLQKDFEKIPEIKGPFFILNKIFDDFITNIQNNIIQLKNLVLIPLDFLVEGFIKEKTKKLNCFKDIEENISKAKINLINKKDIYYNYIKGSEKEEKKDKNINNITTKKDENIFNNAIKENYNQLYQYEMNKMDEIIEENNIKYNNLYKGIIDLRTSLRLSVKFCITKFANNIYNVSDAFNILSKQIKDKIDTIILDEKEEISDNIPRLSLTSKDILKFMDENNEIKEKHTFLNFFYKKQNNTSFESKINTNNVENNFQSNGENKDKNKGKINMEFFNNIIQKIIGEKEVKSMEIIDVYNILQLNQIESKIENKNAKIFLNMFKKLYEHRIISFQNKNNFIHFSNIINSLCLKYKNNNNNILILIIEVSQLIKYKNDYLYKIIQRKNEFFSTKTLWFQLIDTELMNCLNSFVEKKLSEETKKKDNKDNIKEIKEEKNNILEITGLSKKIKDYKKLNNTQKTELLKYGKEKICIIISKSISGMCSFLVPEEVINNIIVHFGTQFKLEFKLKSYLKNKMILKNIKIKNQVKYCPEKEEKLNNKIIIISSIAKFYPISQYPLILKLNKVIYNNLRKSLFLNLLSDKNISIESHLLLWKEYLKIDKLKKKFKYKGTKEVIYISRDKEVINEGIGEEQNLNAIQKDLLRTQFLQEKKEHFEKFKSILIIFLFFFPKIGYCQGMHYIVSFLYQLLDYNEEETFYFFCAFVLNTNYHELFEDNFETLKTFFKVFEKIIIINRPEMYYKFIDSHLIANVYLSSWFITLFTDCANVFKKPNIPKFTFFVIEKFIIEGWSAIFNCGFTLLDYCYDKIMTIEKDKLIDYVMNLLEENDILKNENFEKVQSLYLKNSKLLNEFYIDKLIEITQFENNNQYLKEIIDVI